MERPQFTKYLANLLPQYAPRPVATAQGNAAADDNEGNVQNEEDGLPPLPPPVSSSPLSSSLKTEQDESLLHNRPKGVRLDVFFSFGLVTHFD